MALFTRSRVRSLILFIFPRYPFIAAVTLLLLLAERAERETFPPVNPTVLYINLAIFVVLGICMAFNYKRKEAALIHAGQLLYIAVSLYLNEKLHYRAWVKFRMSHRIVGVAGFMMMYGFYSAPKPRPQSLRRYAEVVIGVYLISALYSLLQSPEDKEAFLKLVPGGHPVLFVYSLLLAACALCFLPGLFTYDMTMVLIFILSLSTLFVDGNLNYWTMRRGLDYWNHMRMLCDNVAIILGAGMILTCSKKVLPLTEDELKEHDRREQVHPHDQ